MEISKLSFTKKTKEQMKKDMSVREKGKVLFARLQELEADGTLSKAKTRADVARLVGYSEERAKAGYAWVSNLIRRGHVSETIQEWTPSGKMIAEYHTTNKTPDYSFGGASRRRKEKHAKDVLGELVKQQAPEPQVYDGGQVAGDTKIITPIKMEITKGDMTIKVEFAEAEQATNLITTIMKGE